MGVDGDDGGCMPVGADGVEGGLAVGVDGDDGGCVLVGSDG